MEKFHRRKFSSMTLFVEIREKILFEPQQVDAQKTFECEMFMQIVSKLSSKLCFKL